jgi:hypothetical protein
LQVPGSVPMPSKTTLNSSKRFCTHGLIGAGLLMQTWSAEAVHLNGSWGWVLYPCRPHGKYFWVVYLLPFLCLMFIPLHCLIFSPFSSP